MRILFQNRKEGVIKLMPDSPDDLWHLQKILESGDFVTARTLRKTAVKRGGEIELGEKRPMTITIEVEKSEFHKYTHKLRLTGKIAEGPEDIQLNSYHSIDVEPGTALKIKKKWKSYHLDRLNKARIKKPLLFICMIDREQADFASLLESGLDWHGSVHFKKIKGKEDNRDDFYTSIMENLEKQKECKHIIVAGPGFERENILNFIKKENPDLAGKIILEYASYIGKPGMQEVLKTSLNKVLRQTRAAEETALVEELLKKINQEGLVAYGRKETEHAIDSGAVETLLVSDQKIKDFEELMEKAEKAGGKIVIISSDHQSGEKFLGIGGIAGFLRFRVK